MANTDFIEIYDNSIPHGICDELVKWFDLCSDNGFTYHNMAFPDGGKQITRRSDETIGVPTCHNNPVSSLSLHWETCNAYYDALNNCFIDYIEKYNLEDLRLSSHMFKIQKVKEGQGYHVWHYENDGDPGSGRRVLAWLTYLKAPEEGGETEFLHQSKRIKPVVGRTLIWPAYFTHLHRGNPPLKGIKYYNTGWFERD
tara:strand:- start:90 stop:683 length:594 start_codon:yes stop_codon:yes gene_type:complete